MFAASANKAGRRQRAMLGTEHIPPALPTKRAGGPVGGKAEHQRRVERFQNSQSRSRNSRRSRAAFSLARLLLPGRTTSPME